MDGASSVGGIGATDAARAPALAPCLPVIAVHRTPLRVALRAVDTGVPPVRGSAADTGIAAPNVLGMCENRVVGKAPRAASDVAGGRSRPPTGRPFHGGSPDMRRPGNGGPASRARKQKGPILAHPQGMGAAQSAHKEGSATAAAEADARPEEGAAPADNAKDARVATLCSATPVSLGEADAAFWTQLLSVAGHAATSMTTEDARGLIAKHAHSLVKHNLGTANLVKLIVVAADALQACVPSTPNDTPPPPPLFHRARGALFLTRLLILGTIELSPSPEALLGHICDSPNAYSLGDDHALHNTSSFAKYLRSLVAVLNAPVPVDTAVAAVVRALQYEAVMGLFTVSATQLYTPLHLTITEAAVGPGAYLTGSPLMERLVGSAELRAPLIEALLTLYADGTASPSSQGGTMSVTALFRRGRSGFAAPDIPLAPACASLLLLLLQYTPPPPELATPASPRGGAAAADLAKLSPRSARRAVAPPFQSALALCQDDATHSEASSAAERLERLSAGVPRISFARVYRACTSNIDSECGAMLFYALAHHNPAFLDFILSQSALEELVIPILALLYRGGISSTSSASDASSSAYPPPSQQAAPAAANRAKPVSTHHAYLLLIVLLIFSQDASFCVTIHNTPLPASLDLSWFRDRNLVPRSFSLGSLLVVVLCRIARSHIAPPATRDLYLLTNALAILTNLAPRFANLDAYAAQLLVGLFEAMAKRYRRLLVRASAEISQMDDAEAAEAQSPSSKARTLPFELEVSEHYLRITLELLHAIASASLEKNPKVAYALLHKREAFEGFAASSSDAAQQEARTRGGASAAEALEGAGGENGGAHPQFRELLSNLFAVIRFFARRLEDEASGEDAETVSTFSNANAAIAAVEKACRSWKPSLLSHIPITHYAYEEEPPKAHAAYFVPYVWRLARGVVDPPPGAYFDADRIALFAVD